MQAEGSKMLLHCFLPSLNIFQCLNSPSLLPPCSKNWEKGREDEIKIYGGGEGDGGREENAEASQILTHM